MYVALCNYKLKVTNVIRVATAQPGIVCQGIRLIVEKRQSNQQSDTSSKTNERNKKNNQRSDKKVRAKTFVLQIWQYEKETPYDGKQWVNYEPSDSWEINHQTPVGDHKIVYVTEGKAEFTKMSENEGIHRIYNKNFKARKIEINGCEFFFCLFFYLFIFFLFWIFVYFQF